MTDDSLADNNPLLKIDDPLQSLMGRLDLIWDRVGRLPTRSTGPLSAWSRHGQNREGH